MNAQAQPLNAVIDAHIDTVVLRVRKAYAYAPTKIVWTEELTAYMPTAEPESCYDDVWFEIWEGAIYDLEQKGFVIPSGHVRYGDMAEKQGAKVIAYMENLLGL